MDDLRPWLGALDRFQAASYLATQEGRHPRFLYKYSPGTRRSLRGTIEQSTFWLASRTQFNDPFEMNLRFSDLHDSERELLSYFRNAARRLRMPLGQRHAAAERAVRQGGFLQSARESFNGYADTYGVCCFSALARDVRMWAHYAAQQTGVCYQFHVASSPVPLVEALRVRYTDEPVEIQTWANVVARNRRLADAFLAKQLQWQSEREYRIVRAGDARTQLAFQPPALVGIIFGCRAPRSLELSAVARCRRRRRRGGPSVQLFRAVAELSLDCSAVTVDGRGVDGADAWTPWPDAQEGIRLAAGDAVADRAWQPPSLEPGVAPGAKFRVARVERSRSGRSGR
jgi:hypothetical protein